MTGYTGNIARAQKPPGERYDVGGVVLALAAAVPDVYVDAEVWLETELSAFDGLCIAAGETRRASLLAAQDTLERLLAKVRELVEAAS